MAGLDGCRSGWILATLEPGGRPGTGARLDVRLVEAFPEVVARVDAGELDAVAVDMPIGLPDGPVRTADTEARRRLGPRRSSVFPTPVRATLGAADYPEALAISRRVCGKGLSKQAYHLLGRIQEVDRAMTPARQDRIFECHPELAFAALAGSPLRHPKRRAEGIAERVALLGPDLGPAGTADLREALATRRSGAGPDDVVDAVVIALVARAVAGVEPTVERLGDGRRDRRGLRMEIVTRSPWGSEEVPCSD